MASGAPYSGREILNRCNDCWVISALHLLRRMDEVRKTLNLEPASCSEDQELRRALSQTFKAARPFLSACCSVSWRRSAAFWINPQQPSSSPGLYQPTPGDRVVRRRRSSPTTYSTSVCRCYSIIAERRSLLPSAGTSPLRVRVLHLDRRGWGMPPWSPVASIHACSSSGRNTSPYRARVEVAGDGTSSAKDGYSLQPGEDGECSGSAVESLVEEVATALKHRCGVTDRGQLLVLVSGGSDSVALLLALHEAAKTFRPQLHLEAAHFNHALRGENSDADEDFVVGLAEQLGIKLHLRRWKGPDQGGTGGHGTGIQERARRWRRSEAKDILGRMLVEAGVRGGSGEGFIATKAEGGEGFIVTAHHWDDQVETVLMKALRGAHITNMQGMAWRSPPFIRPLLGTRKSNLVAFLRRREQEWREDPTNRVPKYARNRVRLQLVPILQELAGGASALDTRLAEISRQSLLASQMVEWEAAQWERQNLQGENEDKERPRGDEFPLKAFLREGPGQQRQEAAAGDGNKRLRPPPLLGQQLEQQDGPLPLPLPELLREELLHRFVTANTGDTPLPYTQLQLLMRQVDEGGRIWSLSLEGGFSLRRVGDFLRVEPDTGRRRKDHPRSGRRTSPVALPDNHALSATTWTLRVSTCGGIEDDGELDDMRHGMVLYNLPDSEQLHVRRRKEGDRFRPAWRDRPLKLKDFLRGQGVPLHRRGDVPLICNSNDIVIAVYPFHPAFECHRDETGIEPVRVKIEGTPLFFLPPPPAGAHREL